MIIRINPIDISFSRSFSFVEDCIEHTLKRDIFDEDILLDLRSSNLFLVNRSNRDVGFIKQNVLKKTNTVLFQPFLHLRACNLALFSLYKIGAIHSVLTSHFLHSNSFVQFECKERLIIDSMRNIFKDHFLWSCSTDQNDQTFYSAKIDVDSIKTHSPDFFDRKHFIGLNIDKMSFSIDI